MTFLHRLKSMARWIVRRDSAEQDLSDELQAFVEMAAADKVRAGATPAEAHRSQSCTQRARATQSTRGP